MDNEYNTQLVLKVCELCGRNYMGHPTSKYCREFNCKTRARRQRTKKHPITEHYRAVIINPSPDQFNLNVEIQSKGTNQKPLKIYQLNHSLLETKLPANVELFAYPPDGILNTEGVAYHILTTITAPATKLVAEPVKHFSAFDILDKKLPSSVQQIATPPQKTIAPKQLNFRSVLNNPTPDEIFAVCDYYAEEVNDLRPTKVFGEPPKSVPEHVLIHNFPADSYYILEPR